MKKIATLIVRYFFQGIIIISPIAVTVWAAYSIFDTIDVAIPSLPRGVGFLIIVSSLVVIGWLGSSFFIWKFLINVFDNILERTPFLKFIYGSVKDVVESFMGDKRKFTHPVLVKMRNSPDVYQMGFVTQNDLSKLGLDSKVAVYLPHSYAISGVLVFVDKENITPVNVNPTDAMKMVVSGGVTGYDDENQNE
ncbi:MAG TPA: DUF502 domain-containing protein [Chitinophagaceae bacterium]|nr:MAG: membrane protein [Bacteroidetes bacterium OLB11]HMN32065.1 DUF502 domain-containing protein [Chitinophagaceae bacterium]